jgi:hypothetical protein
MSMLYRPEKIPVLSKAKELAFFGTFLLTALLAMAAWIYFLGSIILRLFLWSFS